MHPDRADPGHPCRADQTIRTSPSRSSVHAAKAGPAPRQAATPLEVGERVDVSGPALYTWSADKAVRL